MKTRFISFILACFALAVPAMAASFVNITPLPKQMKVSTGELALPTSFVVADASLADDMKAEVKKFISTFSTATGITVTEGAEGLITITQNSSLHEEGYNLTITAEAITIEAGTPAGLYYAFQTLMKAMPANVILGKYAQGSYSLPLLTIKDEPRYHWRGIEIDCARHYFSVDQLKKMLDIMAVYKMNRLHWHLTDDQGWRLEIPKYPKLTTIGATAATNYMLDFDTKTSYMLNEPYGPYFYSTDEIKDLVAYAKERHIEICPEIDMPGHMQAAIAAYPEFSTTPEGEHPVRYWPGVSTDVLDISNPAVVQFLKDVMDQLIELFPYEYIHIGGDECPTTAWANSASCQQFKKDYGLQSDQAIQNWLTRELSEYVKPKGRRLICWNEVLTAHGADKQMAKDADLLIYAWLNAGAADNPSKQAADLGLRSVWCSTNHYYIDYPQWSGNEEPLSMGFPITLETVYNVRPDYDEAKKELYYGVNCNLWTEYISDPKHLEYNTLPRMIAVAETGWTPQSKKNFENFKARFNADTKLLDLGNYTYGRHYVDGSGQDAVMPEDGKFYRLITQASADAQRRDRCIELVHDGCPLISEKSATAGLLWTNTQAAEDADCYDWQYWTFEADPNGSGKYAMVNRMAADGSVDPAMSGSSISARWNYDFDTKHYNFILGEHFASTNQGYTYSIRSDKGSDWYINCAQAGQNQTVNNWNRPDDGNGGIWLFALEGSVAENPNATPAFTPFEVGKTYVFENAANPLACISAGNENLMVTTADDYAWAGRAWTITAGEYDEALNTQTLTLSNAIVNAYIGAAGQPITTNNQATNYGYGAFNGDLGAPISITDNAANAVQIKIRKVAAERSDFVITLGDYTLFPVPASNQHMPNAVNGRQKVAPQMNGTWNITPVEVKEYNVISTDGAINESRRMVEGEIVSPYPNYGVKNVEGSTITLERISWNVTYKCMDSEGALWETLTEVVPVDQVYTPYVPEFIYLENGAIQGDVTEGTLSADMVYTVVYTANCYRGALGESRRVSELEIGKPYLIYDMHSERNAYRGDVGGYVKGTRKAENLSPTFTWVLEESDKANRFYIKNLGTGKYVQRVVSSTPATTNDKPYGFTPTYNADTQSWSIKNGGNNYCWDGLENLDMVGWNKPGHPYAFCEFIPAPYYAITVEERDQDGELLNSTTRFVAPGSSYVFAAASRPGKELVSIQGNDGLDEITSNKLIVVTYSIEKDGINEVQINNNAPKGIFDLSGRRLNAASHPGIYIIDGVKTLIQ